MAINLIEIDTNLSKGRVDRIPKQHKRFGVPIIMADKPARKIS
jgi:hypothetical protein